MSKQFDLQVYPNMQSLRTQPNKLEKILKNIQSQKIFNHNVNIENKSSDESFSYLTKRVLNKESPLYSLPSQRIHLQNDNIFNESNKKVLCYQLPKIQQKLKTLSKANFSQERICQTLQNSELIPITRRKITDSEEIQYQDQLNIKKLNEQLGNKQDRQNQIRWRINKHSYPEVSELNDLSKQIDFIYKKNNINPVKIKASQNYYSSRDTKNSNQSIEFLIKLLKESRK
ncbi:unnamed protein product (macronuclear) [Paramecium tetraurelia]|uniref:Uncharacterized protein n=1 Tax=Paramecium tetraurelia TaxID=5888 RepID=A0DDY5_PARTE|nr:uncharacterized protein GSPATT00016094001 [Paramecium tetraurelia]CAK81252.1 unnamed protein product [Paramecium tetraurelia]|eukprot:XP_001448649.1 hypothetical protein (macronuclear) [Paramecium tetraurelia strain d4-2]